MRQTQFFAVLLLAAGCGTEHTLEAGAQPKIPPSITRQPRGQVGKRLGSVTFDVVATGSPPLTYRWHRDGKTWPGWNRRSLTLVSVTENDVGTYTVTVSNAAGSVTSEGATLTFGDLPLPAPNPGPPPPAATQSPAPPAARARSIPPPPRKEGTEYFEVGQNVTLIAVADGSPPFTFQWRKDGRPIPKGNGAVLTIENGTARDAGTYDCVVTNSAGDSRSQVIKLVVWPP